MSATLTAPWVVEGALIGNPAREESPVEAWVRQLQAGQSEALEPLIEHTQNKAWQVAYAILQNRQEVEDAMQDAYLLVYQNIHQLKEPRAFWGWFKRILVNRCLRLHKRPLAAELPEEPAQIAPEPSETRLDINQAFSQLSASDRTVLGLREILDYTYEEIAQVLEVPLTTVKTRLYNARNRFCKFFARDAKGESQ